jgi:WD40 repeat protein
MPPCGRVLISDEDGVVHVKEMKNGLQTVKKIRVFPVGTKIISMCTFDDKALVGVMSASELKVFDFMSGKVIFAHNSGSLGDFEVNSAEDDVVITKHFLGFSPSGDKLICSTKLHGWIAGAVIIMFDLATKGEVFKLEVIGAEEGFNTIELSKDEKYLVTAGFNMWVTVWDVDKKEIIRVVGDTHDTTPDEEFWHVKDIVLNGSATFLNDHTISVFTTWMDQHEEVVICVNFLTREVGEIKNLKCDTFNVVFPANKSFPIAYIDDYEACIDVQRGITHIPTMRVFLHNAEQVTGSFEAMFDEHICTCVGGPVRPQCPATAHSDRVTNMQFSPNEKFLVSCGKDYQIMLWNIAANRLESSTLIDAVPTNIAFISDYMEKEKIAFCMCMHERLGVDSGSATLGDNMLCMVLDHVCKGGATCDCE